MQGIISALDGTLQASVAEDLRRYLAVDRGTKFSIYSDYCLDDKHKPSKVASFSIIPYDHDLDAYPTFLNRIAPRDLKSTRLPKHAFLEHIAESRLFHVSFMFGTLKGITESSVGNSRAHIDAMLEETISMVQNWPRTTKQQRTYYDSLVRKLLAQRISLQRKSANLNLFRNSVIVSLLAAYLAYLLTRHANASIVGWFSDRDKIIDAWNGIAFDLFAMNHHALCERDAFDSAVTKLVVWRADCVHETYVTDAMNRIPDHLAGALASWSLETNTVQQAKHSEILQTCFADNPFCSIIKLSIDHQVTKCSRVVVSRKPIDA